MMNRQDAMFHALRFLQKSETEGDYFEFGVFQGRSLATAYKIHSQMDTAARHFYAFDSFSGLPHLSADDTLEDYSVFHEGQFAVSMADVARNLVNNGVPEADVTLVEGFYDTSLTDPATLNAVGDAKAALVHIDCDLYSSAVPCLRFIEPRMVDGAILMFDDWFCYRGRADQGVHRAFDEWAAEAPYTFTEYAKYTWSGIMFICNTRADA